MNPNPHVAAISAKTSDVDVIPTPISISSVPPSGRKGFLIKHIFCNLFHI